MPYYENKLIGLIEIETCEPTQSVADALGQAVEGPHPTSSVAFSPRNRFRHEVEVNSQPVAVRTAVIQADLDQLRGDLDREFRRAVRSIIP